MDEKTNTIKLDMIEDENHRKKALMVRDSMIELKKLGYPIRNIQTSMNMVNITRKMMIQRSEDILIAEFGLLDMSPEELISKLSLDFEKEIVGHHVYKYPDESKTIFIAYKK